MSGPIEIIVLFFYHVSSVFLSTIVIGTGKGIGEGKEKVKPEVYSTDFEAVSAVHSALHVSQVPGDLSYSSRIPFGPTITK